MAQNFETQQVVSSLPALIPQQQQGLESQQQQFRSGERSLFEREHQAALEADRFEKGEEHAPPSLYTEQGRFPIAKSQQPVASLDDERERLFHSTKQAPSNFSQFVSSLYESNSVIVKSENPGGNLDFVG